MGKPACCWNFYYHLATFDSTLASKSFIRSQHENTLIVQFIFSRFVKIFITGQNNHCTGRTTSFCPTGVHEVYQVFLDSRQYRLGIFVTKNFFFKTGNGDFWHNFDNTKETIFDMESKLNEQALKEYSSAYANKILAEIFNDRDHITGEDILKLSKVKQVNLFVIFQLMRQWRIEAKKLESTFFDFSSKGVKKALKDFMNTLSRHIRVSHEAILPLVEKSVADSILLFLSPYNFYCNFIGNWGESRVRTKDLKELSKYIKINNKLLVSFIERLEQDKAKDIFSDDALRILNEVFEATSHTPEDIDPYVSDFSDDLPLDVNTIYGNQSPPLKPDQKVRTPTRKQNGETPILNDQLAQDSSRPTLADIHKQGKIESIKTYLSINQKFMFVNQLFDGNMDDFNKVVDFLDNCPNQAEAMDFINNNYLKKSNWKKDSAEVKEFIEVVAKKYGIVE